MKILVCEDDEVVLKVIELALQKESVDVTYVRDGRQAMDLLQGENEFGLIITDIHMPYYNGDDILKLIREVQKKNTPIIMISSDTEEEVISLALKSGVNEFIGKPIDIANLAKRVRKYL